MAQISSGLLVQVRQQKIDRGTAEGAVNCSMSDIDLLPITPTSGPCNISKPMRFSRGTGPTNIEGPSWAVALRLGLGDRQVQTKGSHLEQAACNFN